MSQSLTYGGYRWVPLTRTDLSKLTGTLDAPELRQWLVAEHAASFYEAITNRLAAELNGRGLTFVIRKDKQIVGFTSLSDYHGMYGVLQTSTYLHPDQWGTGLNGLCKSLLWFLAHELLEHPSIVASVHLENERSQAAMRKSFSTFVETTVFEFWRPRTAQLFEILGPPTRYTPLSKSEARSLRRLMVMTPAWQRWSLHTPGTAPKITSPEVLDSTKIHQAVSEVLIEAAPQVAALANEVADADTPKVIFDQAIEVVNEAQHNAAETLVDLADHSHRLTEDAQSLVVDAVAELREDAGQPLTDTEREEVADLLTQLDPELEPWLERGEN